MRCFNHRDREGLAICKHCGKALCGDCLVESPAGVSCRGECESKVRTLERIFQQANATGTRQKKGFRFGGVLFGVLGLVFLALGTFSQDTAFRFYLFAMGSILLLAGIYAFRMGQRTTKN